jgi:hypothetical protein
MLLLLALLLPTNNLTGWPGKRVRESDQQESSPGGGSGWG